MLRLHAFCALHVATFFYKAFQRALSFHRQLKLVLCLVVNSFHINVNLIVSLKTRQPNQCFFRLGSGPNLFFYSNSSARLEDHPFKYSAGC